MIYVQSAIIFLFTLHYVESGNKFKKNASDFIDVGFNKGRTGTRLAEIAVKIRPGEMFEGGESVSVDDLVLEVKSGEDCWSRVEDRPVKRGKDKQAHVEDESGPLHEAPGQAWDQDGGLCGVFRVPRHCRTCHC